MNTAPKFSEKLPLRKVEQNELPKPAGEYATILELLGWSDLPPVLVDVISDELDSYEEQIREGYCIMDQDVLARRHRIRYWVNAYRDGICSLAEAIERIQN